MLVLLLILHLMFHSTFRSVPCSVPCSVPRFSNAADLFSTFSSEMTDISAKSRNTENLKLSFDHWVSNVLIRLHEVPKERRSSASTFRFASPTQCVIFKFVCFYSTDSTNSSYLRIH